MLVQQAENGQEKVIQYVSQQLNPAQRKYVTIEKEAYAIVYATLVLPEQILRNTETGALDIAPQCYGARPRVCQRGLVQRADIHPCLARLLTKKPAYSPYCTVILQRRLPVDVVYPQNSNKFIFITNGTKMALRCAGQAEQPTVLKAGVYELSLDYPCSLNSQNWTLLSTFQRTLNITLRPRPFHFALNVTFTELFLDQLQLDSSVYDLPALSPVDRKQLTVRDLITPVLSKAPVSVMRYLWHLTWGVVLVVGTPLVGCILARYHRQCGSLCLRPAQPAPHATPCAIELQPMSRSAPQSTSPVVSTAASLPDITNWA